MNEQDYIDLQTLLIKLRVNQLKILDRDNLINRDKIVRNIRAIDTLRKNIEVDIYSE